jgi:ATP-dependent DNA helicase RecG
MSEKKDILGDFKQSETQNILVATTVIEVGVDVPQASLAIILNAERFGLSALHQIRGRVGRNDFPDNQCVLVTYPKYGRARRLKYLTQTQDGFALAEKDLEIRGAGDVLGKLQSGFGDEIDKLIGLNPELYSEIDGLVKQIDLENLENLPRLEKYLQTKVREVWKE